MTTTIRVTLVEDSPEYSEVIKLALDDVPDMKLISQFGTSEIALRTFQNSKPDDLPDLILLDLNLPGRSGLDSITDFLACAPDVKIIVLTQSDKEEDVLRAITLGAAGYLLKSATLNQLIDGIRTVIGGGASLDAGVAKFILNSLQSKLALPDTEHVLTEREVQVLRMLAEGFVKKEIAKQLDISYATVDTHVSRIYAKLHVTNAPSAVNQAHRLGIFRDE